MMRCKENTKSAEMCVVSFSYLKRPCKLFTVWDYFAIFVCSIHQIEACFWFSVKLYKTSNCDKVQNKKKVKLQLWEIKLPQVMATAVVWSFLLVVLLLSYALVNGLVLLNRILAFSHVLLYEAWSITDIMFFIIVAQCHNIIISTALQCKDYWIRTLEVFFSHTMSVCPIVCLRM